MPRTLLLNLAFAGGLHLIATKSALAASPLAQSWSIGPGGYLSGWKLATLTVIFLIWVKLVDWMNVDGIKIGKDTGLKPEIWNPLNIVAFLVGFWCAISIPIFWAGLAVYVTAAFLPWMIYVMIRRGKLKANPQLKRKLAAQPGEVVLEPLPQDAGAPVRFRAAGSGSEQQANLINARRSPAFPLLKDMVADGLRKRAEVIVLDFTRDAVRGQMMIDGLWHPLEPMDRPTGDALLAAMKSLAGLNPADRRSRQQGRFTAIMDDRKIELELLSQGTPTGERAQLKYLVQKSIDLTLTQLGMMPDLAQRFSATLNKPGLIIVSAPPQNGLTTTWRSTLLAADRITRDWVAVIDVNEEDSLVENVQPRRFSKADGQSPADVLKPILLAQPDGLAVPELINAETLDILTHEIVEQRRTVLTQLSTSSAAEALFRIYALAKDKRTFVQGATCVTGQRLVRRLCDKCKQPVQVRPQVIQQLGGDPRQQNTLYKPYRLPPPEKRVDEQGKPIEMVPCPVCQGVGYIGRIAIFEMIFVNDSIRETLLKAPSIENIQKAAAKAGNESLQASGYRLVLLGVTSIEEVQRVLKPSVPAATTAKR